MTAKSKLSHYDFHMTSPDATRIGIVAVGMFVFEGNPNPIAVQAIHNGGDGAVFMIAIDFDTLAVPDCIRDPEARAIMARTMQKELLQSFETKFRGPRGEGTLLGVTIRLLPASVREHGILGFAHLKIKGETLELPLMLMRDPDGEIDLLFGAMFTQFQLPTVLTFPAFREEVERAVRAELKAIGIEA